MDFIFQISKSHQLLFIINQEKDEEGSETESSHVLHFTTSGKEKQILSIFRV